MDSSNIDNQLKASVFNIFKHLLCKYYTRFFKIDRVGEHLNQFLMLLHDCMPILSQFLNANKLLKNVLL